MFVTDQDQRDALQRCFENWRDAQPPGEPGLRQELAYRDGFADALQWLRTSSDAAQASDDWRHPPPGSQFMYLQLEAD
ncbi:MAG: hypothetical protein IPO43_12470 [Rhodoferax sp.]|nr:hypothetical protein [Rhodoferax sp.]